MALNSLSRAHVPLSSYSLTHGCAGISSSLLSGVCTQFAGMPIKLPTRQRTASVEFGAPSMTAMMTTRRFRATPSVERGRNDTCKACRLRQLVELKECAEQRRRQRQVTAAHVFVTCCLCCVVFIGSSTFCRHSSRMSIDDDSGLTSVVCRLRGCCIRSSRGSRQCVTIF